MRRAPTAPTTIPAIAPPDNDDPEEELEDVEEDVEEELEDVEGIEEDVDELVEVAKVRITVEAEEAEAVSPKISTSIPQNVFSASFFADPQ